MAITRNFRPAQHVYQSTYEPLPFQQVAPIAMQMQQEYNQGLGMRAAAEAMYDDAAVASFDRQTADRKLEEMRGSLDDVLKSSPDARSPEFNLGINKVVRKAKSDKFWQATAHNAEMEKKWQKILNNDNLLPADKFELEQKFAEYASKGTEGAGLLPEPTAPERVDYQEFLDNMGKGFVSETVGLSKGKRLDEVAYKYGYSVDSNGRLNLKQIPPGFFNTKAGETMIRDAKYAAVQNGTDVKDELVSLYTSITQPLVRQYSGMITDENAVKAAEAAYNEPSGWKPYEAAVYSLGDEETANKMKEKYKGSSFIAKALTESFPMLTSAINPVARDVAEMKNAGRSRSEILEYLDTRKTQIQEKFNNAPESKYVDPFNLISFTVINGMIAPVKAAVMESTPTITDLTNEEQNGIHKFLAEYPELIEQYEKDGITDNIWDKYKDYSMDFYTKEEFTSSIGKPEYSKKGMAKAEQERMMSELFGYSYSNGAVKTTSDEDNPTAGLIPRLAIYKEGEVTNPTTIDKLDLPTSGEVQVQYLGKVVGDNAIGPNVDAISIEGKTYYIKRVDASVPQQIDHFLNSYKYNHEGIGVTIPLGESGRTLTPKVEYTIGADGKAVKEYVIETNDGITTRSTNSIEEAYQDYKKYVVENESE